MRSVSGHARASQRWHSSLTSIVNREDRCVRTLLPPRAIAAAQRGELADDEADIETGTMHRDASRRRPQRLVHMGTTTSQPPRFPFIAFPSLRVCGQLQTCQLAAPRGKPGCNRPRPRYHVRFRWPVGRWCSSLSVSYRQLYDGGTKLRVLPPGGGAVAIPSGDGSHGPSLAWKRSISSPPTRPHGGCPPRSASSCCFPWAVTANAVACVA
jgi:hypothetical protein